MRPAEFVSLTRTDPQSRALTYVRSAIARALNYAKFDQRSAEDIARERWGDTVAQTVAKSAVGAMTGAQVEDAQAFFALAAEGAILGKVPLRRWNFRVRTLASGGIVGGEVAEGAGTPIRVPSLSSFRLDARKFQAASILTREALERGGDAAEIGLRDDLLRAASDAIDGAFVTDLIAATDSSGFTGDHRYGVFLLHPSDAAANADLRLDVRGGWFRGYPAFVTNALTPGTAVLFDASRVAAAWSEGEIDFSQYATIEQDDAPTQSSVTPATATSVVSLFQSNSVAVRSTMFADWHIGGGAVEVVELGS